MWNWLLGRKRIDRASIEHLKSTPRLDVAEAIARVKAVNDAATRAEVEGAAHSALAFVAAQSELLHTAANGYPRNPISVDVWMGGTELARACDALADSLGTRGLREEEAEASRLAVSCACSVVGHYPEKIFPRVLRHARCQEALGKLEVAIPSYAAVVRDFQQLELDQLYLDDQGEPLGEPGRTILIAVSECLGRLRTLAPAEVPPGLSERITARLG